MRNVKTPYLDFYYDNLRTCYMTNEGLCKSLLGVLDFMPTEEEFGEPNPEYFFWAYDGTGDNNRIYGKYFFDYAHEFTPLRQTIVLFLAAMNGEL